MEQEKLVFTVSNDPQELTKDLDIFVTELEKSRGVNIVEVHLKRNVIERIWLYKEKSAGKMPIKLKLEANLFLTSGLGYMVKASSTLEPNQMKLLTEMEKNTNQYYTFIVETKEEN